MENHENEIIKELQNISKELQGIKRKGLKQVFSIIIAVIVSIAIGIGGGIYINRNWDEITETAGRFYVLPAVYSLFLLSFKIRSIILFETPVNLFS